MPYVQRERGIERTRQHILAEAVHAEYKIDRDVSDARVLQTRDGIARRGGSVAAVHEPQLRVVERLHSQTHAVYVGPAQRRDILGRDVVGIRLHGNLLRMRAVEQLRRVVDEPLQLGGVQQRRRPAAEIHCTNGTIGQKIALLVELVVHRPHYCAHAPRIRRTEKIAVGADTFAKRYMKIYSRHTTNVIFSIDKNNSAPQDRRLDGDARREARIYLGRPKNEGV